MNSYIEKSCWEIMQCSDSRNCQTRLYTDVPCWEVAKNLDSGQTLSDVCQDCIVRIAKANKPILTKAELDEIQEYREVMRFVDKCPAYENSFLEEEESLSSYKVQSW